MTALIGLRDNLRLARLHLITEWRGGPEAMAALVSHMFSAGVDVVQVREATADRGAQVGGRHKRSRRAEFRAVMEALVPVALQHRKLVCVGRDVELAGAIQADLLHLGASDGDLARARARLRQYSLVGRSVHTADQVDHAAREGADWLTVGPVFGHEVPGLDLVGQAAQRQRPSDEKALPWFAVGGITLDNLDEVLGAGAARVAVSSAIMGAQDPVAAAAEFSRRLTENWRGLDGAEGYASRLMGEPRATLRPQPPVPDVGMAGLRAPADLPEDGSQPAGSPPPRLPLPPVDQVDPQVRGEGMVDPDVAASPARERRDNPDSRRR